MALATGQLPFSRGVLYVFRDERTVSLKLVNNDAGTDYAEVYVYLKPADGSGNSLVGHPLQLGSGEPFEMKPLVHGKPGDQIEGHCTAQSYIDYVIDPG